MTEVARKIDLLKEFKSHPDRYLPIIDHVWKVFPKRDDGQEWYDDPVYNIGWDTGLLPGNRPYFLECWATCGITMLTYFLSTIGMEDTKAADLISMLESENLFRILDPENSRTEVQRFADESGNEFFSVNVVCGDEEGTYIEGGKIYSFKYLNEFNRQEM